MPTKKISDDNTWVPRACRHPEHDPPQHRVFEPGTYRHACLGCGAAQVFTVMDMVLGYGGPQSRSTRHRIEIFPKRASWKKLVYGLAVHAAYTKSMLSRDG